MQVRAQRSPGVYFEERGAPGVASSALRTGVPVFVGLAEPRDADGRRAMPFRHVDRWVSFEETFATPFENAYLAYAVRGFFENGGEHCVVVPVHDPGSGTLALAEALVKPFDQGGLLEDIEEIDLVCVPDAMLHSLGSSVAAVCDIQSHALEHCRRMGDRFAILDALPSRNAAVPVGFGPEPGDAGISGAIQQWQALPSGHGGLYFPWLCVESYHPRSARTSRALADVEKQGEVGPAKSANVKRAVRRVPPCGHIAGVYARTDARVGVHKAPANEIVEGALSLSVTLSDEWQADLNEAGVNCLRSLPGRGIRVWGARTLSKGPDWRYVNVNRIFLTLARWLKQNMSDFVFEPHSPQLWDRIRRRLSGYCRDLFDRGALMGRSPGGAFFVKCDGETNPPEVRERGVVVAEVGLAAVSPAEFVVVRIAQTARSVTLTGVAGS